MKTVDQSKRRVMVNVMFDQEILAWIHNKAKEMDLSTSKVIELAVSSYMESLEMEGR